MFNISQYLERFKKITPPDSEVRKSVSTAIKDILHIDISTKDISIKRGVVYIITTPAIKSKIFMRKNDVMSHVKKGTGEKTVVDIR